MNKNYLINETRWSKKELKALWGSAEKWLNVYNETGIDKSVANCPCCKKFYTSVPNEDICVRCPISRISHQRLCGNTPYEYWSSFEIQSIQEAPDQLKFYAKEAAKEEYIFIIEVALGEYGYGENSYTCNKT